MEGPAGDGEAAAPSSAAAPAFGRLDVGPFPDGIRAGWVCPCGEGGYLLTGASQDDVAGYETDQFDHAETCPQSGAL